MYFSDSGGSSCLGPYKGVNLFYDTCLDYSEKYSDKGNYVDGANIAGFIKVAQAMVDQGFV